MAKCPVQTQFHERSSLSFLPLFIFHRPPAQECLTFFPLLTILAHFLFCIFFIHFLLSNSFSLPSSYSSCLFDLIKMDLLDKKRKWTRGTRLKLNFFPPTSYGVMIFTFTLEKLGIFAWKREEHMMLGKERKKPNLWEEEVRHQVQEEDSSYLFQAWTTFLKQFAQLREARSLSFLLYSPHIVQLCTHILKP